MTIPSPSTAIRCMREDGKTARSWSDLPNGLVHTILMCLGSLVDLISFKSVCRSWRAVASSLPPSVITSHFPPLLLFPTFSQGLTFSGFGVFDPTSPSFLASLSLNLDKLKFLGLYDDRYKYRGLIRYSHGHLLGLLHNRIVVINLFTGHEFYTPVLPDNEGLLTSTGYKYFPHSFWMLTSPVSSPDSGILLFTRGHLLYWRIGSASWSCRLPRSELWGKVGIVTVRGTVYAMNSRDCNLCVLEFSPELHLRPLAVEGINKDSYFLQHFLVDCGGELLHVRLEDFGGWHSRFEVFRLDSSVNEPRWVKKETLGNWAIFVGCDFRLPGLAVENPERWGGSSNCIYYNKVYENRDSAFAVFKLGDELDLSDQESPLHPLHRAPFLDGLSAEWFRPGF